MLYVDVVFLMQDPINSMKALRDLLDLFAQSSGYKVNISKSVLMGLNITSETRAEGAAVTAAPWSSCIRYLGIRLSASMDPTSLIDLNLKPIINSSMGQFENYQKLCLSWLGRVAALKMKILLRFIFIFWSFTDSGPGKKCTL